MNAQLPKRPSRPSLLSQTSAPALAPSTGVVSPAMQAESRMWTDEQVRERRRRERRLVSLNEESDDFEVKSGRRETLRGLAKKSKAWHEIVPVYQGYGTHYIDLWVGCPLPQRQTLLIDTGSDSVLFPCSRCTSGEHASEADSGCGSAPIECTTNRTQRAIEK
jgi:hypothetical protein